MADRGYDVVIVGGGVMGAVVAKVLAERSLGAGRPISILLLEAGRDAGATSASHKAYLDQFYAASIKTPNSPYPNIPNAPSPEDIPAFKAPGDRYFKQIAENSGFGSTNLRALGGTTLHWMGISLRMMPSDFESYRLFGKGVDWPIGYDDLKPYYEMAEWELGVSARREDQLGVPGAHEEDFGDYEYPMDRIPPSHLDRRLSECIGTDFAFSMEGVDYPVRLIPIPQARNSIPNPKAVDRRTYLAAHRRHQPYRNYGAPEDPVTGPGQRCEGNASCIPICPARAKYTALKTIEQLKDLSRLPGISIDIITKAVATGVRVDGAGRATQVDFQQYDSETLAYATPRSAMGRRIVLAASAIENAKLLLASRNNCWPDGLANSSKALGKNLMDHPFVLAWGLARAGEQLGPFRGPGATSDLPMRDGAFRKVHAAFRTDVGNWGWGLTDDAPARDIERLIDPAAFRDRYADKAQQALLPDAPLVGKELRTALRERVQRQVTMGFLLEQMPSASNRVTIDDGWRDQLGNHKPVIQYTIDDYTRAGIAAAYRLSSAFFARAGIEDFTDHEGGLGQRVDFDGKSYRYIGAGHIMGTHRMGNNPRDSVVDSFQRSWDHENLYVVGCGSMPTAGTANPTLTAVALCIRSAEKMFEELD